MKQRLPLILSATALVVALFGSTSVGHAIVSAVPLAKHAQTANFAKNAGAVNGLKASKRPRAGWLVALGKGGKFPASVGQVGPAGPQGPPGLSNGPAGGALTGSYPNPKLADNAVGSANVADASLRLSDLGGPGSAESTRSVTTAITLAPKSCVNEFLGLFNPPVGPTGASVLGGMVIGGLTDAAGKAAVDNLVAVAPAMLIETSQGGAIENLVVCNATRTPRRSRSARYSTGG